MSDETEEPDPEQSFLSHLVELRQRIVRAAVAIVIVFIPMAFFMQQIFDFLSRPMMAALPAGAKLLATGVITPFMVPLKVTLFAAFLVALPYVLWQAWAFVAPGLYRHEKRLAGPLIASSVLMFFAGMAYCYFVVFGFVFKFIAGFAPASVAVSPDIEAYFGFVIELLYRVRPDLRGADRRRAAGPLRHREYRQAEKARPYVIVGAFIVAAIFTPPDVLSQLLLAIPLCILYELGILIARFVGVPKAAEETAPQQASSTT